MRQSIEQVQVGAGGAACASRARTRRRCARSRSAAARRSRRVGWSGGTPVLGPQLVAVLALAIPALRRRPVAPRHELAQHRHLGRAGRRRGGTGSGGPRCRAGCRPRPVTPRRRRRRPPRAAARRSRGCARGGRPTPSTPPVSMRATVDGDMPSRAARSRWLRSAIRRTLMTSRATSKSSSMPASPSLAGACPAAPTALARPEARGPCPSDDPSNSLAHSPARRSSGTHCSTTCSSGTHCSVRGSSGRGRGRGAGGRRGRRPPRSEMSLASGYFGCVGAVTDP